MYRTPFHEYSINIDGCDLRVVIDQADDCDGENLALLTMHTHAHAELFVCTENTIVLKTDSGFIQIRQGEIAIVPPNVMHLCISDHREAEWDALGF